MKQSCSFQNLHVIKQFYSFSYLHVLVLTNQKTFSVRSHVRSHGRFFNVKSNVRSTFPKCRNEVNRRIKDAKINYYKTSLENSTNSKDS